MNGTPFAALDIYGKWDVICTSAEQLAEFKVKELDKYLDKHKLPKQKKLKGEKVKIIATHVQTQPNFNLRQMTGKEIMTSNQSDESDSSDSDDSESEMSVIGVLESDDPSESESDTDTDTDTEKMSANSRRHVTLRSGRVSSHFF